MVSGLRIKNALSKNRKLAINNGSLKLNAKIIPVIGGVIAQAREAKLLPIPMAHPCSSSLAILERLVRIAFDPKAILLAMGKIFNQMPISVLLIVAIKQQTADIGRVI